MKTACDDRLLESLRYNCGDLIMNALENPEVVEIMLNPDGKVWVERYGHDQELAGELPFAQGRLILSLVASALGQIVKDSSPWLEGEFPLDGSRFEGAVPPIVGPGASFSLRKKAAKVFTLAEYQAQGAITKEGVAIIEEAVARHKNIVVVGGTSSGKTTFVNAVIDAIARLTPSDRLLILQDTAELQSNNANTVFFHTSDLANVTMRTLAKISMRYAPKRILVGEVRDSAALELLKLWNTGHPGGIGTFHADSAAESLERLEELVEEAGVGPKQKLIGRAVDLVVYMEKTKSNQRRVTSIIRVTKYDSKHLNYITEQVYAA